MTDFPSASAIFEVYGDQVEGLERLYRARARLSTDPRSRFCGLSEHAIGYRLEQDRQELDGWVMMMLVASFEATVRTDAKRRIASKTRDEVRKPLRDLHREHRGRVRLIDILAIWEARVAVTELRISGLTALRRNFAVVGQVSGFGVKRVIRSSVIPPRKTLSGGS